MTRTSFGGLLRGPKSPRDKVDSTETRCHPVGWGARGSDDDNSITARTGDGDGDGGGMMDTLDSGRSYAVSPWVRLCRVRRRPLRLCMRLRADNVLCSAVVDGVLGMVTNSTINHSLCVDPKREALATELHV